MSSWVFNVNCPQCDRDFYVSAGNLDDPTTLDVEAVECPHCGRCWEPDGGGEWMPLPGHEYTKRGHKTPAEAFGVED